ncbi:hypothetical protein ES332_D05G361000v1 [Gossypium tomentosum]|uniref:Uncharacterized protein n=1 Tax=Gossypium tomentosum TaxID=34277 RepID=A0A5D2L4B5_GOSTO|nr:hypothetical protein ES332_D05G361000v1 [Gossypium tomentosum]
MEIKEDDHNQFDMLEGSFANEFDYGLVEDFSHDARPVNSPKLMEDYLQWEASFEYFFEMKPMVDLGRYTRNALMAGKHVLQDGARRKLSRKSDGIAQRRTRGEKGKALVRFEAGNGSHYCFDSLEQRVNITEKEEQDDDMLDPIYNEYAEESEEICLVLKAIQSKSANLVLFFRFTPNNAHPNKHGKTRDGCICFIERERYYCKKKSIHIKQIPYARKIQKSMAITQSIFKY